MSSNSWNKECINISSPCVFVTVSRCLFILFPNPHFNWERTERKGKSKCGHHIYLSRTFQPSWITRFGLPDVLDHLSDSSSGKCFHINSGQSQSFSPHFNVLFSQHLDFSWTSATPSSPFSSWWWTSSRREPFPMTAAFPRSLSLWPVMALGMSCWLLWLMTTV